MIKTLIKSTRITWASKTVNMYFLALTYAYFAHITIKNSYEILEGLIMVCVLWGALYSLNDLTDIEADIKDHRKMGRAFVQDSVEKRWILLFSMILIFTVFLISFTTMKPAFTFLLALMLLNQVVYTVPPVRLKNTLLAPFTSTATNTVLRLASCSVLLGNVLLVPLSVYFFMYVAGMGTYLMYKSKVGQASVAGIIGCLSLVYIFYWGDMNWIQFSVAVLPAFVAAVPLYLSLFFEKDKLVWLADVLYHQVAMIFFLICIIYILV
jgi:4-hydroxybenzoate polyprenyltransferase